MTYKRYIISLIAFAVLPFALLGQTFTDHIERSFRVKTGMLVDVQNKYGKIHIVNWDKDSVKFEIDVTAKATTAEKLSRIKESISFSFPVEGNTIKAQTVFSKSGGLITEFVDAFVPTNEVVIDYTVYLPKTISLNVDNKFGNVFVDEISGNLNINLSNGNLKANQLLGKSNISVSSGDANIHTAKNAQISVSYSDLEIRKADELSLETKSSRVDIDQVNNLKIKSRRDKYHIVEVKEMFGSGYFTTIEIENLSDEVNLNVEYGGMVIDDIYRAFKFINLESENTDIDLYFQRGSSYYLDITHHQDVSLKIPSSSSVLETKELNPDEHMMITYGQVGNNVASSGAKVKITAKRKCMINIIHK